MNKRNLLLTLVFIMPTVYILQVYTMEEEHIIIRNRQTIVKQGGREMLNNVTARKRGKRYLHFTKGARMSWRATVKNNILNINNIWAYGYGFRANFPFPVNSQGYQHRRYQRSFHKREMFQTLVHLFNAHGLDGEACLLKSYCTALLEGDGDWSDGMLFKLLKYVFSLDELERQHFPYLRREYCHQILHSHCPLSFNSISPYTDDV